MLFAPCHSRLEEFPLGSAGGQCKAQGSRHLGKRPVSLAVWRRASAGRRIPGEEVGLKASRSVRRRLLSSDRGAVLPSDWASGPESQTTTLQDVLAAVLPTVAVEFTVPCLPLAFGDSACLVGETPELGCWDPRRGVVLDWQAGNSWVCRTRLPPGHVRFKVVKLLINGTVKWETGADRSLTVPQLPQLLGSCATLQVSCPYDDAAGARVHLGVKEEEVEAAAATIITSLGQQGRGWDQVQAHLQHFAPQGEEPGAAMARTLWQRLHSAVEQQWQQGEQGRTQGTPAASDRDDARAALPGHEASGALHHLAQAAGAAAAEAEGRAKEAEELLEGMAAQLQANAAAEDSSRLLASELSMLRVQAVAAAGDAERRAAAQREQEQRLRAELQALNAAAAGMASQPGTQPPAAVAAALMGEMERLSLQVTAHEAAAKATEQLHAELTADAEFLSNGIGEVSAAAAASAHLGDSLRQDRAQLTAELGARLQRASHAASVANELGTAACGEANTGYGGGSRGREEQREAVAAVREQARGQAPAEGGEQGGLEASLPTAPLRLQSRGTAWQHSEDKHLHAETCSSVDAESEPVAAQQHLQSALARVATLETQLQQQEEEAAAAAAIASRQAEALGQEVQQLRRDKEAARLQLWAAQGTVATLQMQLRQQAEQASQAAAQQPQQAREGKAQLLAEGEEVVGGMGEATAQQDAAQREVHAAMQHLALRNAYMTSRVMELEAAKGTELSSVATSKGFQEQQDTGTTQHTAGGSASQDQRKRRSTEPHSREKKARLGLKAGTTGVVLGTALSYSWDLMGLAWSLASHPAPWQAKVKLLLGERVA